MSRNSSVHDGTGEHRRHQRGREIATEQVSGPLGRYDGLALMLVGVILIVIGDLRFTRNKRLINDAEPRIMADVRTERIVTIVVVLLVAAYCASILVG